MAHELEPIFRELGLSQYLDTFVDQGFDCWDTILDIQESDLYVVAVSVHHDHAANRFSEMHLASSWATEEYGLLPLGSLEGKADQVGRNFNAELPMLEELLPAFRWVHPRNKTGTRKRSKRLSALTRPGPNMASMTTLEWPSESIEGIPR